MNNSGSAEKMARQRAKQLKINENVLEDAFKILDAFRHASREGGEWPDFDGGVNRWDEERYDNRGEGFTIPAGGYGRPIPTGVPVNVIPTNKNNPRGKCCPILFVHIKQKTSSMKQQEIITETGQHVSDICPNTDIIIIHGTLDYYVWNDARHQLKKQLVFLQPIRHSYLVLDPDWR